MGKLISFWTLRHRTGVTTLALLSAIDLSKTTNANILLVDTNFYSDMMKIIDLPNTDGIVIDNLINLVQIGELTCKNLPNNVFDITENLHILPGTVISSVNYLNGKENEILKIIELALTVYDIVIVDCNAGLNTKLTGEVLDRADLIVDILEQDGLMLNDFSKKYADVKTGIFAKKEVLHVVSKYSKYIYPQLRELETLTGYSKILQASYDEDLRSAFNNFNLSKFYEKSDSPMKVDIKTLTKNILSKDCLKYVSMSSAKKSSGLFKFWGKK